MAEYIARIRTEDGDLPIDYNSLANLPKSDPTLSNSGDFADAKATGDAIKKPTVIIDKTLTVSGQAADAYTTGLKFDNTVNAINDAIDTVNNRINNTNNDVQAVQKTADDALPKSGGDVSGIINMNNNTISGLKSPTDQTDAANKDYVDSKHFFVDIDLVASKWVNGTDQYEQTIDVENILDSDRPHYCVVYSSDKQTRDSQKEAFAMVDDLVTSNGSITVICFENKPTVDFSIQLEVNR